MPKPKRAPPPPRSSARALIALLLVALAASVAWRYWIYEAQPDETNADVDLASLDYQPREPIDASGFTAIRQFVRPWKPAASLAEIRDSFHNVGHRGVKLIDQQLAMPGMPPEARLRALFTKVMLLNYEGEAEQAYRVLAEARDLVETDAPLAQQTLYSVIYLQGVTALRRGENDNCILCRGESSCILPIAPSAVHTFPKGSRLAIKHFTEYLDRFPDDLELRWLLNVAHMTLGEHPQKVDPKYLLSLDRYEKSAADIGRFRDIGHLVGVNRLNQAGGAIMDDFDNDGLLDIVTTTFDATGSLAFFRNTGDAKFENQTEAAGLSDQLGGLNCVQTDYNNDGHLDIFVIRGAWFPGSLPIRPSLLRNDDDGTFTDVTREAGLLDPVNSIAAQWADYDNDGWLDLFICCEQQPNRLYRNLGNGKFADVARRAGVAGGGSFACKGAAWIDYDNDGFPDLFLNHLSMESARMFRNNKNGTFTDITRSLGIDGPVLGFSCWSWDYDNDGWLDIFATCYDRTLEGVVQGLTGKPHKLQSNRLFRNREGKNFENVTQPAGLDMVFQTMGSNFADFDNDGYLDMYLGTGEPNLATLVPNRMFKNVAGRRFADVTASSGTGNLQKGHGVACGDWDRDGDVDLFIQMGGVINGDKYHNILFQNPGHDNRWLSVKLIGQKTNRAAIGARIKVVVSETAAAAQHPPPAEGGAGGGSEPSAANNPRTIHRHISSGSSFGANPLEQTIGLGNADRIARLEIHWPTSGTTQVFRDLAVNQAIEVTEFADAYRELRREPIAVAE
ncbi:MAG: CRTAC1 family protein [Pirellulales bacterium]